MSNFSSLYGNVCNYSFSNRYSSLLWSRFQPPVYDTAQFTPDEIGERRKCEILKYKPNTTQSTKKQRFAAASRGSLLRKKGFASQTDTLTDSNTANLPEVNGVLICPSSATKCTLTTESDVPGPPRLLCLRDDVPLYGNTRSYEYKAGQVLRSRIPTTALTSPNNVVIVGGNNSLVVTWMPPDQDEKGLYGGSALTGYLVAYSTDRTNWTNIPSTSASVGGSQIGYVDATILTYTINNLRNNTLYYVKIYSVTTSATSTFPAISSGNTFLIPSKPVNFNVSGDTSATIVTINGISIDKTNIIATWSPPSFDGGTPITSYDVEYSRDKITWTPMIATIGTSDLIYDSVKRVYTYRFTGPNPDGLNTLAIVTKSTYYVRVRANNVVTRDGYTSPYSETLSVNTMSTPSAVTGVTLSSGTLAGTILLAWNAPVSDGGNEIQAYTVSYYKTTDPLKRIISSGSTTLTKFTVSGLDSDNLYYTFLISALNGTYTSVPYEITGRANTVVGKPIGLKVAVTNGQFNLSFVIDDAGGSTVTSYIVRVSRNTDQGPWVGYEYVATSTQSVGAIQLNLSTSPMISGSVRPVFQTKIPYYFRVSARNSLFPTREGVVSTPDILGKIIVIPNPITNIDITILSRKVISISPSTGQFIETDEQYLLLEWFWVSLNGGSKTNVVSDDIGGDDISHVGYILEYSETAGDFKIWTFFNTASNLLRERSLAFTYIKPETTYYFRIYAVNTAGRSNVSIVENVTTGSSATSTTTTVTTT
jgi:hypothetical protein